jgi:hypothetical protein
MKKKLTRGPILLSSPNTHLPGLRSEEVSVFAYRPAANGQRAQFVSWQNDVLQNHDFEHFIRAFPALLEQHVEHAKLRRKAAVRELLAVIQRYTGTHK